jgi:prolyl-tRNA synthetase
MLFTKNFIKSRKTISSEIESINGQLLTKAGFIHQEIAGVYTFLPLGLRVLNKIEDIIRKHMDEISSEIVMTSLHPRKIWEQTERLTKVDVLMQASGANEASTKRNDTSYILGSTHEEMVTPLVKEFVQSYKDLPVALYQIQTKFRNEARAKSGLLRGREFRMKDLYSFHISEEDLLRYYEVVKQKYLDVYNELGLGDSTFVTLASGGDFTTGFSHEFQTVLESGEDIIYLYRDKKIAYNKEVVSEENAKKLGVDFEKLEKVKASEVGNIFPLNTKFSQAFDFTVLDANGEPKIVYMGSYGIGPSRLMGVIVEKFSDVKGMIWPENIAPFTYHIVTDNNPESIKIAQKLYKTYKDNALWDDRTDVSFGEKLFDADLIGCPQRLVVTKRSIQNGGVEVKQRNKTEAEIQSVEKLLNHF